MKKIQYSLWLAIVIIAISTINVVNAASYKYIEGFSVQVNQRLEEFLKQSLLIKETKIAIFDCDGALLNQVPYYLADEALYGYAKRNYADKKDVLSIKKMNIVRDMLQGNNVGHKYVENRIRFFSGLTVEKIEAIGKDYYYNRYKRRFYPNMRQFIDNLKRFDFQIWIITASPEFLYQAFVAQELGIPKNHIIGTKSIVKNGISTDQLVVPTPQDEGKAYIIETYIKHKPLIVVGNSRGDMEMMNSSEGLKIIVNPDDKKIRTVSDKGMSGMTVKEYWKKQNALIVYSQDIDQSNDQYVSRQWGAKPNKPNDQYQ